jgi:multiple sugar transport system substrate-binding protein
MFMVKDFWAVPEYAELLTACQQALASVRRGRQGHRREAMNALEKDWEATFKKYSKK